MDIVQSFKKVLELDLDTIQDHIKNPTSLESVNYASEKLNHLLENNIGTTTNISDQDDRKLIETSEKSTFDENMRINSGVDGINVKTFEDLIKCKLQNNLHFQSQKDSKLEPTRKQSFLKKRSGLKRFHYKVGNYNKQSDIGDKQSLKEKNTNFGVRTKSLNYDKKDEIGLTNIGKENKSELIYKKVVPISKKTTNQAPRHLKIIKDSEQVFVCNL